MADRKFAPLNLNVIRIRKKQLIKKYIKKNKEIIMSIKVKCQKCQSEVETQEVFIGQEIECPDCHQFFCV